jgi:hypothetical protein
MTRIAASNCALVNPWGVFCDVGVGSSEGFVATLIELFGLNVMVLLLMGRPEAYRLRSRPPIGRLRVVL